MPQHASRGAPEPQGQVLLATRLRYDSRMLRRADDLAKMTVLDEHGQTIQLDTLWRDKPAVLVFIRHFG
jgi:hypothetical protein